MHYNNITSMILKVNRKQEKLSSLPIYLKQPHNNSSIPCSGNLNEVKCSLTELTTRSDCSQWLSVPLLYLHMCLFPRALRCTAYSLMWPEEGAFCVERLALFSLPSSPPPPPSPLLSAFYQCDGCLSSWGRGGSWLVCQVLPIGNIELEVSGFK